MHYSTFLAHANMFSTHSIFICSTFLLLSVAVNAMSVNNNYSRTTLHKQKQRNKHGLPQDSKLQPVSQQNPAVFSYRTQQQILKHDSPSSDYEQVMVAQGMETTTALCPMQTSRAFHHQQQQQQQYTRGRRQTWSGKPIVVADYVDDVYYVAAHDDNKNEQQPLQLAAEAAKVQPPSLTTSQSRAPQTFHDASVHHNHQQLRQQAFHANIGSSVYRLPFFSQKWLSLSSPPTGQTRALKTKEWLQQHQQKWSWPAGRRAPSALNRAKLERLAAFAPFFERYVKNYPHRLQANY